MSEELKQYRVLKPVAISGIVQPGGIVGLTESEAINIGIGEYLEEVAAPQDEAASAEDTAAADSETETSKDDTVAEEDAGQGAASEDAGTGTTGEQTDEGAA